MNRICTNDEKNYIEKVKYIKYQKTTMTSIRDPY